MSTTPANDEQLQKLKDYLGSALMREMETRPSGQELTPQLLRPILAHAYAQTRLNLPNNLREQIFQSVLDEIVGFGPLQPLLDDASISEILVDGAKTVYVERSGELLDTGIVFRDDEHLYRIIDRMLHPLGRRVDPDHPMADGRLPDGSRINVIVPPVAIEGPCLSIRKFLSNMLTMDQLIEMGAITTNLAEFLQACVAARLNIVITGNTSSGKTTMLNVLTGYIPINERIITIEDAVELQLKQKYLVRLETKNPGMDGTGEVTTRDLVRNALRMRPDRIVIGEVRGGEALDMLQAMNTGHSGSITTLHANSPRDVLSRLETMTLMAGLDLPLLAIRRQMASALNLIIHLSRLQDGSRRIVKITEITGMESDIVTMQDIFIFEQQGIDEHGKIKGEFRPTGLRPVFSPKLEVVGYKLRGEIFGAGRPMPGAMRNQ